MDIQKLFADLSKTYWTESHPSSYTMAHPTTGAAIGLGVLSRKSYAAFNLTVMIHGTELSIFEKQVNACSTFGAIAHLLETVSGATEVEGMLTLLSPEEFCKWYLSNSTAVPEKIRPWIENALSSRNKTVHKV